MKFVFFGTPYVARDTLDALVQNGYTPEVVVTNPDAPRGRGHVMTPSETKVWAEEHDIPTLTPERLDEDFINVLKEYGCAYAVVVAYGKILPEALIASFPKGVINVHYSLLPKYRGASPTEGALLNGDTVTGVTIQQMVRELDAGDILAQKEVPILPEDTTKTLRPRLIEAGATLLLETLPLFEEGSITPRALEHASATHAGKIQKEDGCLDLSAPALENWNKYRASAEWPGTFFFTEKDGRNIRVKVNSAHLTDDGVFEILRVTPEGKKEMDFEILQR